VPMSRACQWQGEQGKQAYKKLAKPTLNMYTELA